MKDRGQYLLSFSVFEAGSLRDSGGHLIRVTVMYYPSWFLHALAPNSGPHACVAGTLLTEPSPHKLPRSDWAAWSPCFLMRQVFLRGRAWIRLDGPLLQQCSKFLESSEIMEWRKHGTLHCFCYSSGYKLSPGAANSNKERNPELSELSSFPSCAALGAYDKGNLAAAPGSFPETQNLHFCDAPGI